MAAGVTAAMRRKLAAGALAAAEGGPGADRSWRLSLARAARDVAHLPLEVAWASLDRLSLAELLELAPERGLLLMLEGPAEGLGLLALSAPVLAGMIEMQTMGRVSPLPAPARKPTRTDAAMVAALIDSALAGLEAELSEEADLVWAGGFRYASFLEDARPLGLLLEDQAYRVLRCEVSLAQGAKGGEVLLALPAEGRGRRPDAGKPTIDTDAGPAFAAALADQVLGADAEVRAMVGRVTLPLSRVMALAPGDLLALGQAALDRVALEGIDGCGLASGRLGQTRGMRAVRIVLAPGTDAHQPGTHQPGTPSLSGLTAAPTGPVLAATGTG